MSDNELNKVLPEVLIKLAGQVYPLKLTFRVLCTYQRLSGKNPFSTEWYRNISPADVVDLITASLKKDKPEITAEEVEEQLETVNLPEIIGTLAKMIGFGSPESKEPEEKKI